MRLTTGVAAALLLVLAACGAADDPEPGKDAVDPSATDGGLVLDFESGPRAGQRVEAVTNAGTEDVEVSVVDSESEQLESVAGPDGGLAVRFPRYTGAESAPAAVLVVAGEEAGSLSPGERDFEFGATFALDPESSGSKVDDGDNLVQRGSFSDPGQFKIQLDEGVPSCRIAGAAGEVFVTAEQAVDPGVWYSVSCAREGSEVRLIVTAYDDQGNPESFRASGPSGTISFKDAPLSVGGKVDPTGKPVASADQFNGAVDDVFLRID